MSRRNLRGPSATAVKFLLFTEAMQALCDVLEKAKTTEVQTGSAQLCSTIVLDQTSGTPTP